MEFTAENTEITAWTDEYPRGARPGIALTVSRDEIALHSSLQVVLKKEGSNFVVDEERKPQGYFLGRKVHILTNGNWGYLVEPGVASCS